ncbi:unnamed protein product, partial [Mesorhabditis belari]|uniref:Elongator complex protein 4 n=1 Tax=Mesorhabditis belari TaxID=2138241 RepID=A0AAF3EEY7_9BILA
MQRFGDAVQLPGCTHKLGYLQTSTGNTALDSLLGGSLPNTALCVVDELLTRCYGTVLLRYFASEGAHNGHDLLICGPEARELLQNLPTRIQSTDEGKSLPNSGPKEEDLKIAWRYQTLQEKSSNLGQTKLRYDLGNNLEEPTRFGSKIDVLENDSYETLLGALMERLKSSDYNKNEKSPKKRLLRIVIRGLGSPLWTDHKFLPRFLCELRLACRNAYAVVMCTIDTTSFQEALTHRIETLADALFRLKPIEEKERKALGIGDKAHGYFQIIQLPRITSAAPFKPESVDLTFELHRKSFDITVIHLPPAFGDDSTTKESIPAGKFTCSSGLSAF